jgi:hypothetical protein
MGSRACGLTQNGRCFFASLST